MSWLMLFLARLTAGERLRKATPAEYRYFAAYFFLIPILGGLAAESLRMRFLDAASAFTLWALFTAFGASMVFGSIIWARFVAAKVSWILGGIVWLVVVSLALLGHL